MRKNILRILLAMLLSVFVSLPAALAQEYEDGGIYTDEDGIYYRYDASKDDFIELSDEEVRELEQEDGYDDYEEDDDYGEDYDDGTGYSGGYSNDDGKDLNKYEHLRGDRPEGNLGVNKFAVTNSNIPYILKTPYVDTAYKIYDFAGVLTDKQKSKIRERAHLFCDRTGCDIAIVILASCNHPRFDGLNTTESFIRDFYDYNDFKRDGLRLCLDLQHSRNSVYDAGKLYDAGFMSCYIDEYGPTMRPYFDGGQYYEEIMWFIEHAEQDWLYESSFPVWKCLIFGTLLALVIFYIHYSKYKLVFKGTSANNYKVSDSFELTKNSTRFVRTFTTKTYSPRSKGGGGSSSGGGGGGGSF